MDLEILESMIPDSDELKQLKHDYDISFLEAKNKENEVLKKMFKHYVKSNYFFLFNQ